MQWCMLLVCMVASLSSGLAGHIQASTNACSSTWSEDLWRSGTSVHSSGSRTVLHGTSVSSVSRCMAWQQLCRQHLLKALRW